MLQRPANNVLNRMTDLIPGRSKTQRAIFPRQLARPVRQVQQLGLGQAVSAHCPLPIAHCPLPITHCPLPITHYPLPITHSPGHSLDLHPAGFALHTPHGVQQHHAITPDRDEFEATCGQQVVSGRNSAAARTMRLGAWTHVDLDDAGGFKQPHSGVDEAWKVVAGIEQPSKQHGRQPWCSLGRGTRAASRCMNTSGDNLAGRALAELGPFGWLKQSIGLFVSRVSTRCVVPSRQGVLSLSTTCPAALVCTLPSCDLRRAAGAANSAATRGPKKARRVPGSVGKWGPQARRIKLAQSGGARRRLTGQDPDPSAHRCQAREPRS